MDWNGKYYPHTATPLSLQRQNYLYTFISKTLRDWNGVSEYPSQCKTSFNCRAIKSVLLLFSARLTTLDSTDVTAGILLIAAALPFTLYTNLGILICVKSYYIYLYVV